MAWVDPHTHWNWHVHMGSTPHQHALPLHWPALAWGREGRWNGGGGGMWKCLFLNPCSSRLVRLCTRWCWPHWCEGTCSHRFHISTLDSWFAIADLQVHCVVSANISYAGLWNGWCQHTHSLTHWNKYWWARALVGGGLEWPIVIYNTVALELTGFNTKLIQSTCWVHIRFRLHSSLESACHIIKYWSPQIYPLFK